MKRVSVQVAVLLLGLVALVAQAGEVLSVDGVSGAASVDRLGTHFDLKPGDQLSERDLVKVGAGGSLSLAFAGHGFIEMGPGSEIAIEKLPFASYADDLQTIFSFTRGYLRVVWKLPPQASTWPLFVYFGSQHGALSPGEYFFDDQSGAARACVAAGRLSVLPRAGGQLQELRPSACYRFVAALPPEKVLRESSAWIAVRRGFSIDAPSSPEALLAANDAGNDEPAAPGSAQPLVAPVQTRIAPPAPPKTLPPQPGPRPAAAAAGLAPPAPAAPSSASDGSGEWGVNIASYPAADDADRHAQQLRAAGYAATVQQAQVKGQTWFRVQLRGYPSADAARAVAGELQARFSYQGLWVNKTGPAIAPAP